jgi:protein-tyrosine kinase
MPNDFVRKIAEDSERGREMSLVERAAGRMRPAEPEPAAALAAGLKLPGAEEAPRAAPPPVVEAPQQAAVELPVDRLRARGLLTPGNERSKLAEQYRLVKRPLLNKALAGTGGDTLAKLIMVTSARPGEGKTFTAFNLALSIAAERHLQVILVDADPHRGQVLDTLGLEKRHGFMEYLAGEVQRLSEVLLPTERENLWVLPAGRNHNHSTELLAGPRMTEFISELALAHRPRIVIFDSPPVLASTESTVLAQRVGQIVMVVEAQKTQRRTLEDALALLNACPNVNLLLNKSHVSFGAEGYGGYGGYGNYHGRA